VLRDLEAVRQQCAGSLQLPFQEAGVETTHTQSQQKGFRFTPGVRRRLLQLAGLVVLQAAALFIPSGSLRWPEGWVYIGYYIFFIGLNALLILPRGSVASDLMEERSHVTGMKSWDKAFAAVYALSGIGILVVAGLDERLSWSPSITLWVQGLALIVMLLGYGLFSWAMATNAYFSARVRIQADRGQEVVSDGPYRLVRHPGYAGVIPSSLALPVMLASLWALIPALLLVLSVVARTALEDRTLLGELHGYRAYARQVRFRLVPGVW
jgi:protein-S-isoprenylcysteine O-methyltransferase Ste14